MKAEPAPPEHASAATGRAPPPSGGDAGSDGAHCYLNDIPSFVEDALGRLYGCLHASLPFFELFRSTAGAHCYVSLRAGRPASIFVFTLHGRRLGVLNEMIEVSQEELEAFARYVFARFERVDIIRFPALRARVHDFAFPLQQHPSKATYCIALPATPDEYTARIGKSTRASIHRGLNGLRKRFPSFGMAYRSGRDIDEAELRDIIQLSEANIRVRGARVVHDVDRITALARKCGFVSVLFIEGRVCAGWINYRIGDNFFNDVMGFDRRYEKFGLGKLCGYQTIREAIARGGKRFYLGGGIFEYKERLLGRPVDMDELNIYRSRRRMLLHLPHVARALLAAGIRRCKDALHRNRKHMPARLVLDCFYLLKSWGSK